MSYPIPSICHWRGGRLLSPGVRAFLPTPHYKLRICSRQKRQKPEAGPLVRGQKLFIISNPNLGLYLEGIQEVVHAAVAMRLDVFLWFVILHFTFQN